MRGNRIHHVNRSIVLGGYCSPALLHYRETLGSTGSPLSTERLEIERAISRINRAKRYRKKDSTQSPATRKHIKGPLMVVAMVAAIDLVQLPIYC